MKDLVTWEYAKYGYGRSKVTRQARAPKAVLAAKRKGCIRGSVRTPLSYATTYTNTIWPNAKRLANKCRRVRPKQDHHKCGQRNRHGGAHFGEPAWMEKGCGSGRGACPMKGCVCTETEIYLKSLNKMLTSVMRLCFEKKIKLRYGSPPTVRRENYLVLA